MPSAPASALPGAMAPPSSNAASPAAAPANTEILAATPEHSGVAAKASGLHNNVTPGRGTYYNPDEQQEARDVSLSPYFAGCPRPVLGESRMMTPYECATTILTVGPGCNLFGIVCLSFHKSASFASTACMCLRKDVNEHG